MRAIMDRLQGVMCRLTYALLGLAVTLALAAGALVVAHERDIAHLQEQVAVSARLAADGAAERHFMQNKIEGLSVTVARLESKVDVLLGRGRVSVRDEDARIGQR
jgi:hypothetical protein